MPGVLGLRPGGEPACLPACLPLRVPRARPPGVHRLAGDLQGVLDVIEGNPCVISCDESTGECTFDIQDFFVTLIAPCTTRQCAVQGFTIGQGARAVVGLQVVLGEWQGPRVGWHVCFCRQPALLPPC